MSISQPSKEAVFIDLPSVKNFRAKFQYNFFVPEEGTETSSGVPLNVVSRPAGNFDASFIDQLATRVPRFVRFDFTPVVIPPVTKEITDRIIRDHAIKQKNSDPNYIKNNITKIMDEDFFALDSFTAVNLNDQSIATKLFDIVSGTATFLTEERKKAEAQSQHQLAKETNAMTSDEVSMQFLSKYLVQPTENNTFFFEKTGLQLQNEATDRLKNVNIHVQVNSKLFHDIVNTAISNPHSTFSSDYTSMHAISKVVQRNAKNRTNSDMIQDDYKTSGMQTSLEKLSTSTSTTQAAGKVVGYIIDKYEVLPSGEYIVHDPIVIENPYIGSAIDYNVKYYANYMYAMRTIAEFTVPSIVEDTNELVIAKMLITSHPVPPQFVTCTDDRTPPAPADFNFHWNYDTKQLGLTWAYPPTAERDVKKFQVFRRASTDEPFQLLQVFDFDDSMVKPPWGPGESFHPALVKRNLSPTLLYSDVDFTKDSTYIYALASIDAHGLTSNYSEQYEISFDKFKNRLIKERISSSGAPKPYPNFYLQSDTFVDLIHTQGHRTMKIVFNPDHLNIYNNNRQDLRFLATTKDLAKYRMSFINTDLQVEQTLDISLEDLRLHKSLTAKFAKTQK